MVNAAFYKEQSVIDFLKELGLCESNLQMLLPAKEKRKVTINLKKMKVITNYIKVMIKCDKLMTLHLYVTANINLMIDFCLHAGLQFSFTLLHISKFYVSITFQMYICMGKLKFSILTHYNVCVLACID